MKKKTLFKEVAYQFYCIKFLYYRSLPKSVGKMINFCHHQVYLQWQKCWQLLFAIANFEDCVVETPTLFKEER